MGAHLRWTGFGDRATAELEGAIRQAKGDDPLAPVTVITPTPAAAVALRRALARRLDGMIAVGFLALDALAELIAARRIGAEGPMAGTDREVLVAAVRTELAANAGSLSAIAHHRSTWESVASTITEIGGLDDAARAHIAKAGGLPAEMVRVHDAVAARLPVAGRAAVTEAATAEIGERPGVLDPLGPIIVHTPGRLDHAARRLLVALAGATEVTIIGALTGDIEADTPVRDLAGELGASSPPADVDLPVVSSPTGVITGPDVEEEIKAVLRRLLLHADAGTPLHRIAIVHPRGVPYSRAISETLRAAQIPFSGPGTETLGHSAAGRVLRAVLDLVGRDYPRDLVVDLWASGVVVNAEGKLLPAARMDARTRRLAITSGLDRWRQSIADQERWLLEAATDPEADDDSNARRANARAGEAGDLAAISEATETLVGLVDAAPRAWDGVAAWVETVIDTLCGPAVRRSWPDHELDADTAIRTAAGRLTSLGDVEPEPDALVVVDTVRDLLDHPAPRRASTGTGILVTTVERPPVVGLDAVAVVGMTEGMLPRVHRDDVLLGDDLRGGAGLVRRRDHTADQHRGLLTALASTPPEGVRLVSFARGDQRSGRTQTPSRWLTDGIEAMVGYRPRTKDLTDGAPVDGVHVVPSHAGGLAEVANGTVAAVHRAELELARLAEVATLDGHALLDDPTMASAVELVRSRAAKAFTRFDGNLDGVGFDPFGGGRVALSPTRLETYASCPRRWFFGYGLGVGSEDRPEEVDRLLPTDKGKLAHKIMERFIGEAIASGELPAPDEHWSAEQQARLVAIAGEELTSFERRGLTGHRRWWMHDRHEILGALTKTLEDDNDLRAEHQSTPVAVEMSFGRDGNPPLVVELTSGRRVALAGQVDRLDDRPGGVLVIDYKYGASKAFKALKKDPEDGGDSVAGGTKLQLVAYAEAAREWRGGGDAHSTYWFLRPDNLGELVGYTVDDRRREQFEAALSVLVDGIHTGRFPARSGPYSWFWGTHENCSFCPFDSICPADRDEEWERVRHNRTLAELVTLAEEGTPALVNEGPAESPA
ncbi:MAG TPA: PD-(D/E)XK nuclease family protein [Acidimicrobiales bacterium]